MKGCYDFKSEEEFELGALPSVRGKARPENFNLESKGFASTTIARSTGRRLAWARGPGSGLDRNRAGIAPITSASSA